ncbi:AAA family ATPase, partial [Streptomyces sp. NPDC096153]|uniref:AAA family ATPase n=1 Tax=Streptomyces sp. NPDC096153 TaxID=3155548 RepID=UPI00332B02CC
MGVIVVSGTGTEIGKTVVTAAVAATAAAQGRSVAVLKPAQTGLSRGDVFFGVDNTTLSRALDNDLFTPYEAKGL